MTVEQVRASYGARADEYTELLGSVEAMSAEDRRVITEWTATVQGPALDAGSGPGHWTAFLTELGVEITGLDLVPEFVAGATARFPHVKFCVGDLNSLPLGGGTLAGILSWYSVIHTAPEAMPTILEEFSRVLRPGGTLLLGFFEGAQIAPFDHAVHTAWFWPISAMSEQLEHAGFEIVETHTRTDEGSRPHGAILARRVESVSVLASSNLIW